MLREPWESEKVVLTGNLVNLVGQSPGCSVFSASHWNSGYLQLVNLSAERQSCILSGVEKISGWNFLNCVMAYILYTQHHLMTISMVM